MRETPTLDWVAVPSHAAEGPAEVRHKDGWLVCEVPADSYARLMAAAPDVLSSLKMVMALIGGYPDTVPNEIGLSAWRSIRAGAFDAIAKAEGKL